MLSVIFLTSFFIGLRRICLRAKVHNLVFFICSLFTGIDCVTDKLKAIFSWMKNVLYCPNIYSPECLKLLSRALNFQNFPGHSPRHSPPLVKGNYWPLFIQLVTLFKPAGYFNVWNPWRRGGGGITSTRSWTGHLSLEGSVLQVFLQLVVAFIGSGTQSDCLASLQWKPLENPGPLMSLQQNSCSY